MLWRNRTNRGDSVAVECLAHDSITIDSCVQLAADTSILKPGRSIAKHDHVLVVAKKRIDRNVAGSAQGIQGINIHLVQHVKVAPEQFRPRGPNTRIGLERDSIDGWRP